MDWQRKSVFTPEWLLLEGGIPAIALLQSIPYPVRHLNPCNSAYSPCLSLSYRLGRKDEFRSHVTGEDTPCRREIRASGGDWFADISIAILANLLSICSFSTIVWRRMSFESKTSMK